MNKSTKRLIKLFSILGMITTVIVLWELFFQETILPIVDTNYYMDLENRFSVGERRLFSEITIKDGIDAFKEEDYEKAEVFFRQAVEADRSDPEVQIYLNNTKVRQQEKERFILATVVPINNQENNAKTILRGIADAQKEFNDQQGLNGRLLEIMIVDDSNKPELSEKVAQKLANYPFILGVIGHNASSSTKAALPEYIRVNPPVPVISSTSTATKLSEDYPVFFRTVPSNKELASCLAKYAFNHELKQLERLGIFYTKKAGLNTDVSSNYSITFKNDFVEELKTRLKGQIKEEYIFDLSEPNFNPEDTVKSLIDRVDALVLFPSSDKQIINIALEVANKAKSEFKLLGGDTIYDSETLIEGDDAVEGLVLAVPWFAKESYRYTKEAKERWGGLVNWRTATSYDATKAFIEALSTNEEQKTTRKTIFNQLKHTDLKIDKTSGERLRFLSNGDRETPPVLVEVRVKEKDDDAPEGSKYTFKSVDYQCKEESIILR